MYSTVTVTWRHRETTLPDHSDRMIRFRKFVAGAFEADWWRRMLTRITKMPYYSLMRDNFVLLHVY